MRVPFIRTTTDTADTLMLVVSGQPHVLDNSHPRFEQIAELAADPFVQPANFAAHEAELQTLINFAATALETMRTLSERVSVKGDTVFFDGDPIENALTEHIVRMIREGDDNWQAPVNFLENLMTNPAKHVRKRLWLWISDRGMTLTPEGHFIAYKGVQATEDNLSVHSGSNVVYVNGEEHTGYIPNPVDAVVTMPRSEVDNNRDAGCSQGLHVGTFDYARNWGQGRTLTVQVNPRDIVAIPQDSDYAKIRTCRYVVLAAETPAPYEGTTYTSIEKLSADDDDAISDVNWDDDDANDDDDAPFLLDDGDRY